MSSGASLVDSLFRLGKFKEIASLLDKRPDTMRVVFSMGATQKVEADDRNF